MNDRASEAAEWPAYCCAIIRDSKGRYLLEQRPPHAAKVPGRMTCFGGTRERVESPETCLVRELREELGWTVDIGMFELAVRLMNEGPAIVRPSLVIPTGGTVAWFYRAKTVEISGWPVVTEPGHEAVWREWGEELLPRLGAWHRVTLEAERKGVGVASMG